VNNQLFVKLTSLAVQSGDAEIRAWIGRHIAMDIREKRRAKGRVRGLAVRLPNGSPAVLSEAYVKANAVEAFDPNNANDVCDYTRFQIATRERAVMKPRGTRRRNGRHKTKRKRAAGPDSR
jgi:hypothetical protein